MFLDDRPTLKQHWFNTYPASARYLYNICTILDQRLRRWSNIVRILYDQRLRRWSNIVHILYKCFVFTSLCFLVCCSCITCMVHLHVQLDHYWKRWPKLWKTLLWFSCVSHRNTRKVLPAEQVCVKVCCGAETTIRRQINESFNILSQI